MSTRGDVLRLGARLSGADVDLLHRLLAEWQLVADLSFADLLLWVPLEDPPGAYACAGLVRPTTGPTSHPVDELGRVLRGEEAHLVARAHREGRICREGDPEWAGEVPVRKETVPVRAPDGRLLAVLGRDTNLAATRVPSRLELTYLQAAGELLEMVSEGAFPFPGELPDVEYAPRVGDGLLRVDAEGTVVYASPNALSAYRRLGLEGDLLGTVLGDVTLRLAGALAAPRVTSVLRTRAPLDAEVEAAGAVVSLRAIPLLPGGVVTGALVLLRDVTEVRRRDRQILSKDATIREIHHRVKNNLQTVAALLRLQARRVRAPEAQAALEESVRRVSSIALVHETLAVTHDESVRFDGIADALAAMVAEVASPEASGALRVERDGSFGVLPAELASPLAMVLTELLQNAAEHAYPDGGVSARLRMLVRRSPGWLSLVVADEGVGLPVGFDPASSGTLGLQIVRALVGGELGGTVELRPGVGGGTEAEVRLPLRAGADDDDADDPDDDGPVRVADGHPTR